MEKQLKPLSHMEITGHMQRISVDITPQYILLSVICRKHVPKDCNLLWLTKGCKITYISSYLLETTLVPLLGNCTTTAIVVVSSPNILLHVLDTSLWLQLYTWSPGTPGIPMTGAENCVACNNIPANFCIIQMNRIDSSISHTNLVNFITWDMLLAGNRHLPNRSLGLFSALLVQAKEIFICEK